MTLFKSLFQPSHLCARSVIENVLTTTEIWNFRSFCLLLIGKNQGNIKIQWLIKGFLQLNGKANIFKYVLGWQKYIQGHPLTPKSRGHWGSTSNFIKSKTFINFHYMRNFLSNHRLSKLQVNKTKISNYIHSKKRLEARVCSRTLVWLSSRFLFTFSSEF